MLKEIVERLVARPEVIGAAVVSADGLLIERALPDGTDPEALAALATTLVRHATELGLTAGTGPLGVIAIEYDAGAALVSHAGDGTSHVLVLTRPDTDLGALLYTLRQARPELARQL